MPKKYIDFPSEIEGHTYTTKIEKLPEYVFHVGKLIVGNSSILEDVSIRIADGAITEIQEGRINSDGAIARDFSNRIVMPGMIDSHTHLTFGGGTNILAPMPSIEYLTLCAAANATKTLEAGITTAADTIAPKDLPFALRDGIRDGLVKGPRFLCGGNFIVMTLARPFVRASCREVSGPDDARKAAREMISKQADMLKVAATNDPWFSFLRPPESTFRTELTVEEMKAVAEEAHKTGRRLHSHALGPEGVRNSLEAGADVIVHGSPIGEDNMDLMVKKGVPWMTTMSYQYNNSPLGIDSQKSQKRSLPDWVVQNFKEVIEAMIKDLKMAVEKGLKISMGTDTGGANVMHGDNAWELQLYVKYGLTPMQAIIAATKTAAETLDIDDYVGTIETGKSADLLVLNKDPLQDISVLQKKEVIEHIFLKGVKVGGSLPTI